MSDNYFCLAQDGGRAAVVDPGEAAPVLALLAERRAELESILITHRHADHIGGVAELCRRFPKAKVYAPSNCNLSGATVCEDGGEVLLLDGALRLTAAASPGHTLEHMVFYGGKFLFSGDTLFACGCGRVFEGTMEQMQNSLSLLAGLPDDMQVFCGHEYTESNIAFALAVDPQNRALQSRARRVAELRRRGLPTVPFLLGEDKQTNPFLRLDAPAVVAAAQARSGCDSSPAAVFAALRQWKDVF